MTRRPPPALAERLLLRALGGGDSARAVAGDLNEDHARSVLLRGRLRADLWYWRESLALAVGSVIHRSIGRLRKGTGKGGEGPMKDTISRMGWVQDARYARRALSKDKGFFVFATLIIGLGVGATTAVFSVMRPLLLEPLPFEDPDRLVWVARDAGAGGRSDVTSRTSNLRDFRELTRSFEGLTGYNAFFDQSSYNLVGVGQPERLVGVGVAADFLDVLGVEPVHGRSFMPEEGIWDGRPAMILSHGLWSSRFGGDPSIVGTSLTLNDVPREVVGVLPPSFHFASVFTPGVEVDFLLPWPISDETDGSGNTTSIIGRLKPGATIQTAQADLDNIIQGLSEAQPDRWGLGAAVTELQEQIAGPFRSALLLLAAAAGSVMLIVCVNLSNMLLARSPRRRREMAVRRIMGATRGRLIRQLLMETTSVSLLGAGIGAAIATAATRMVTGTSGLELPLLEAIKVDTQALAFTMAVAVLTGLAVGLLPALQVAEGGEAEALSGANRGSSASRKGRRLRELLVAAEMATACVVLIFGALVLRSFLRVVDVDLGFHPDETVAWQVVTSRDFDSPQGQSAFYDLLVEGVLAVPGVEAAALTDALPLGRNRGWDTRVVGVAYEEGEWASFFPHLVDHRYLSAMGIPLVEGRGFTADDHGESAPVAIVNEAAARLYFPDGEAVGHFLDQWWGQAEVVGVAGNVRHRALAIGADPEFYFPLSQVPDYRSLDLVVRTPLPATVVASAIGEAIQRVDSDIPVGDFWTLTSVVERSVSPQRFTLQLLGAFAFSALLLASVGIYGVLSYSVAERTHEIGIRMALGESAATVRRRLVTRTLLLAGSGVAAGTIVALMASRLIGSLLFGIEPTDPATYASIVVGLLAVAALSGLLPAIRASRTDSAGALRSAT